MLSDVAEQTEAIFKIQRPQIDTPSHDALRPWAVQLTEKRGERFCSCGSISHCVFQKGTSFRHQNSPHT